MTAVACYSLGRLDMHYSVIPGRQFLNVLPLAARPHCNEESEGSTVPRTLSRKGNVDSYGSLGSNPHGWMPIAGAIMGKLGCESGMLAWLMVSNGRCW